MNTHSKPPARPLHDMFFWGAVWGSHRTITGCRVLTFLRTFLLFNISTLFLLQSFSQQNQPMKHSLPQYGVSFLSINGNWSTLMICSMILLGCVYPGCHSLPHEGRLLYLPAAAGFRPGVRLVASLSRCPYHLSVVTSAMNAWGSLGSATPRVGRSQARWPPGRHLQTQTQILPVRMYLSLLALRERDVLRSTSGLSVGLAMFLGGERTEGRS